MANPGGNEMLPLENPIQEKYYLCIEMASDQIRAGFLREMAIPGVRDGAERIVTINHIFAANRIIGYSWSFIAQFGDHSRANTGDKENLYNTIYSEVIQKLMTDTKVSPENVIGIGLAIITSVNSVRTISMVDGARLVLKRENFLDPFEAYLTMPERFPNATGHFVAVNRSQAGAIGEATMLNRKGVLYITLSRNIGTGVVIDGQLYQGSHSMAGITGHIPVGSDGRIPMDGDGRCTYCGRVGCLTLFGGADLARMLRERMKQNPALDTWVRNKSGLSGPDFDYGGLVEEKNAKVVSGRVVLERAVYELSKLFESNLALARSLATKSYEEIIAANETEIDALLILKRFSYYFGDGVAQLISFYDPNTIVFGGISSESNNILRNMVAARVRSLIDEDMVEEYLYQESNFSDRSSLIGAGILARKGLQQA